VVHACCSLPIACLLACLIVCMLSSAIYACLLVCMDAMIAGLYLFDRELHYFLHYFLVSLYSDACSASSCNHLRRRSSEPGLAARLLGCSAARCGCSAARLLGGSACAHSCRRCSRSSTLGCSVLSAFARFLHFVARHASHWVTLALGYHWPPRRSATINAPCRSGLILFWRLVALVAPALGHSHARPRWCSADAVLGCSVCSGVCCSCALVCLYAR
jgi:hypothetical protein